MARDTKLYHRERTFFPTNVLEKTGDLHAEDSHCVAFKNQLIVDFNLKDLKL